MNAIHRKTITFLALSLLITILPGIIKSKEKEKASIKFEQTVYDFGMIKEDGGPVTHIFPFTNEGNANLVIYDAKAECGCTTPEFPKKPIPPGGKGEIKVTYNPLGRPGGFTKIVTIKASGSPSKVNLKIRGTVKPKK